MLYPIVTKGVPDSSRKSCIDCAYRLQFEENIENGTCTNRRAVERRRKNFTNQTNCPDWKAARTKADLGLKFWILTVLLLGVPWLLAPKVHNEVSAK